MSPRTPLLPTALRAWARIPALIRAVVLGVVVMETGVRVYAVLAVANLRTTPQIPWAALVAAPLLWVYWRYLGGRFAPAATAAARRRNLRASPLSLQAWCWAAAAGVAGLVFTLHFGAVFERVVDVHLDARNPVPPELSVPVWTLYPTLAMLALVAGVCEEAGVRGYLQGILERTYGALPAILISSAAFTLAHFGQPGGEALAVPFFVASLWYGALTALSRSILPMIAVHTALDLYLFGRFVLLGAATHPPPLAETGVDAALLLDAGTAAFAGVALVLALCRLARVARPAPAPP